jgi:CRISPR/Cas system-associated exonuclease Cas4 (RecB family)
VLLLAAYSDELTKRSLADMPLLYELARQVATHRLLGLPLVCLDLKIEHRCEKDFLNSVVQRSPKVLDIALNTDPNAPGSGSLHDARRWLFSLERPPASTPDGSVDFFSASGEGMECVEIARRIVTMAEEGTPFDHIAIVLRDPERYQPLMEEAIRRAKIPAYFSRGANRPDPAGRAFLALLQCAMEGCSASRFAEYLSLGQVAGRCADPEWQPPADESLAADSSGAEPESPPYQAEVVAPASWEKLLVDAAVIGGPTRWERRLRGLEQEFLLKLKNTDEEDEQARIERRIEQLASLERYALPLIHRLSDLPKQALWGEWLKQLNALAETALQRPESVFAVLADLEPMEEVGPADLEEVYGVLEGRLRFFRREPSGRPYGAVYVCSIEEVRGRSFPVVFLPGLAEGVFPRRALEDPLLLDRNRRNLDAGLALRDNRVAEERRLLLQTIGAAHELLIASYPSMDTTLSRPRVPSFYGLEIVRAVEGRLPDLASFKQKTASGAQTRLSWPAPEQPVSAIDNAEYDLASLKPLIERQDRQPGAARYIVEVNACLGRSLRARGRRWRQSWFDADGVCNLDDRGVEALRQHRLTTRSYSPSSLQQFAQCPYRFALQAIHGLRPREQAVALEEMDPLTRGGLFHAVQFALFRELQFNGLLPIRMDSLDQVFDRTDRVLNRIAAEQEEKLAPAIPRVWATEIEDLRTDLRAWVREVAQFETAWVPWRFEFGFGLRADQEQPHDPASRAEAAVILDGYRVRGSMDLVERHVNGALRIVDHKTGRYPDREPISVGGGEALQPLLYALAGESLWNEPVESARLFYCTHRGGFRRIDIVADENGRTRLQHVLRTIDRAIDTGFLPAAPATQACERCDYVSVCGPYEQERFRRKRQDNLAALTQLRGMP